MKEKSDEWTNGDYRRRERFALRSLAVHLDARRRRRRQRGNRSVARRLVAVAHRLVAVINTCERRKFGKRCFSFLVVVVVVVVVVVLVGVARGRARARQQAYVCGAPMSIIGARARAFVCRCAASTRV